MKAAVKFCGGCNPSYDRVEAAERVRHLLGEHVEFVAPDDPAVDGVIVITGCRTACADVSAFRDKPMLFITSPESRDKVVRIIEKEGMTAFSRLFSMLREHRHEETVPHCPA